MEKLNAQQLADAFNHTARELQETIASFSDETFNRVPFEGSWTPAQVADHVAKSLLGVAHALIGQHKRTEREADKYVEPLKAAFLNFNLKMKSQDFVLPDKGPMEKGALQKRLNESTGKISEVAGTLDLSLTCTSLLMPQLGELTRWEWINFALVHTQRHIHQLENIQAKMSRI